MNTEKQNAHQANNESSNKIKAPEDWVTGDEPMTGAQESYLQTLAAEASEELRQELTKAEASRKIEELQNKTGRGVEAGEKQETESERVAKMRTKVSGAGKAVFRLLL